MANPRPILITGIPAAGKSAVARSLGDEHGYFAFILEEIGHSGPPTPDEAEVWRLWQQAVATGDASRLVKKLRNLPGPVVVEWGFPVNDACLECVRSMRDNGMRLLWFECPDPVARERFVERDTVDVAAFDVQVPAIRSNYEGIEALNAEVIEVISGDGTAKTVEEIVGEIGAG